jgi:hypothetical protein
MVLLTIPTIAKYHCTGVNVANALIHPGDIHLGNLKQR